MPLQVSSIIRAGFVDHSYTCPCRSRLPSPMKTRSGWVELRRAASRFSQILMRDLQASAEHRDSDPAQQYQLGRVAIECIAFRRSLLERRRGPKWSEQEQLHEMEQRVNSVISSLEKRPNNDQSELLRVSKELKEFWRLRKNLKK